MNCVHLDSVSLVEAQILPDEGFDITLLRGNLTQHVAFSSKPPKPEPNTPPLPPPGHHCILYTGCIYWWEMEAPNAVHDCRLLDLLSMCIEMLT